MLNLPPLDELQLAMRFDELRKQLADDHYRPLYGKILAFWAIPSDRRLPRALLNWTLQQVITSQFTDLAATPGIGKKKLQGLLMLLERAAQTDPTSLPAETTDQTPVAQQRESTPSEYLIRWQDVSELMWAEWCATVRKHGLQDVPLGRLAPALNRMTRVLWNIPLGEFLDMTIEDLREERSYGERRLSALLEVFGLLHQILKNVEPQSYLALELAPRRIAAMQQWILQTWQSGKVPTEDEIKEKFILPLLEQTRLDASEQTVMMVEQRLGINGPPVSVRQLGRSFNLTRARIYQLFDELAEIMRVRWPLGRAYTQLLQSFIVYEYNRRGTGPDISQLTMAIEIYFPKPGERRQIVAAKGGLPDLSPGFATTMAETSPTAHIPEEMDEDW
ncbi:MAG TPA: hypothetical protein PLO20_05660 [Thermogutta sp.]|nr:hypothetical protein [Thermogutta sp.]